MVSVSTRQGFFYAIFFFVAVLAIWPGDEAQAQIEPDPEGWQVKVGGFILTKPEYEGSEDYEVLGGPYLDVKYQGWFFANPIDGIGINTINLNGLKIGAAATYRLGRDEDDGRLLNGLGDIDGGVELGAFASYLWGQVQFSTSYKHQVGGDETGDLFDVGIGSGLPIGEKFIILGKISAEFMDSDYADAFFSINAAQSISSGLAVYDAASGLKSVSVSLMGIYNLTDRWAVNAVAKYSHLGDDAADSPIVESAGQFWGGLGVTYKWLP